MGLENLYTARATPVCFSANFDYTNLQSLPKRFSGLSVASSVHVKNNTRTRPSDDTKIKGEDKRYCRERKRQQGQGEETDTRSPNCRISCDQTGTPFSSESLKHKIRWEKREKYNVEHRAPTAPNSQSEPRRSLVQHPSPYNHKNRR